MRNTYPFDWGLWAKLTDRRLSRIVNELQRLRFARFHEQHKELLRADCKCLPAPLSLLLRAERIVAGADDFPLESSDVFEIGYVTAIAEESRSYIEPEEYRAAAFHLTGPEIQALPWPLYAGQPITLRGRKLLILNACDIQVAEMSPDTFFIRLTTGKCLNPDY